MTLEFTGIFQEVAAVLTVATVIGFIGLLLRQPLIVSFIIAGLVAGSGVLGVSHSLKTIDVLAIMGVMGYRKLTGFMAGLTVSQISEFSLIFIAMGVSLGHVTGETMGLVTLVGLVTITLSTYLITYAERVYRLSEPLLGMFERKIAHAEEEDQEDVEGRQFQVIVFGVGRYGGNIIRGLKEQGISVLGVDFDPQAVRHWRERDCHVIYGDAMDPEFVATLPINLARIVVLAFPARAYGLTHQDPRMVMYHALHEQGYTGHVIAVSDRVEDVQRLEAAGIKPVLMPFRDAAIRAVEMIQEGLARDA